MIRGRSWWSMALLPVLLAATAGAVEAQAASQYDIKVAFLINFARYTEWPDESDGTGPSEDQRVEVCVLGRDPFGVVLDELDGREVGTRTVAIRRATDARELTDCHVLFVARSEEGQFTEALDALEKRPILTVGDAAGFIESGGMINLVIRSNKLRFIINIEAVDASGLDLSSRLLRLAVDGDGSH